MQENLSSLPLTKLREMAKERGVKRITSIRKSDLIEILQKLMEQEGEFSQPSASEQEPQRTGRKDSPQERTGEEKEQKESEIAERKNSDYSEKKRIENTEKSNPRTAFVNQEGSGEVNQRNGRSYRVNRSNMSYDNRNSSGNRYGNDNRGNNDNRSNNDSRTGDNRWKNDNRSSSDNRNGVRYVYGNSNDTRSDSRNGNDARSDSRYSNDTRNDSDNRSQVDTRSQNDNRSQTDTRSQNMNSDNSSRRPARAEELESLDSGQVANGILEISNEYGFIRSENYLTGDNDVYVSPSQIRRFNLKTGDMIEGAIRISQYNEKYPALLYITKINGENPENAVKRPAFESLTPIFPDSRLSLETPGCNTAMRIMNLFSPIGKGQRGMIVSPPKAGKTTLLKQIANAVKTNHPEVHIIILLIDERPEEVTDIKEYIEGPNVEVIYSTFDELPEHHKHVSEMVLERAKRLVEHGNDVMILLDSITRLTRAYNLTVTASGRTLSGGLDPAALHLPKKFFGAARNMRNGGSLTILATALVDTGSRMDDVVFEEFKGTGNMEIVLDRKLSERRVFPAIDLMKSGPRRDDLLLTPEEQDAMQIIRKTLNSTKQEETTERVIKMIDKTSSNTAMIDVIRRFRSVPNVADLKADSGEQ